MTYILETSARTVSRRILAMSDYITILNNLIQKITINISTNNINGAIKDSEILKANLDALTESGTSIETISQKIKETSFISSENIESIINDPTCYVFTSTIKQTDGEEHLLNFYNHTENERKFKRAIELFQSNLIQNKCLELMACTNDMQYETSINLMRKVLQLPNENLLNAFVNKLCAFEYPDISINHLMEIFSIEPHQPEFIASELIREAYVKSMETTMQRDAVNDLVQFSKNLFDDKISTKLLHKCCQNFVGFYNLIKMVTTKYLKFIEHLYTDDGQSIWYFNNEQLSANIQFNDFSKFVCKMAASTELSFSKDFLLFLKNTFHLDLLNHIFEKCQ